jgi:alpha-D-ribose 1-methylphosphonate 5-triphosphate synthase subunit PhnH
MSKFHKVFDTQKLFRQLLNSMAYAATVKNVHGICNGCDYAMDLYKSTQAIAISMLDTDTSYCVLGNKNIDEKIAMITYCQKKSIENADYIFIANENQFELPRVLEYAKVGTLIDPHSSATIIVECNSCTTGKTYSCKGPGIKERKEIKININCDWLDIRNEKNIEFPMGVDIIFVDRNYNLLALPRTTQVERV